MKKLQHIALLASLAVATAAFAQTSDGDSSGPRGPRGRGGPGHPGVHFRHHGPGMPVVRALDADKDHVISAAELANASAAILALDKNGDGAVSIDDFRPERPADAPERPAKAVKRIGRKRSPQDNPVMLALDADGDRTLSASEIANATASLSVLDANKDGQLTVDELRPLPPEKE